MRVKHATKKTAHEVVIQRNAWRKSFKQAIFTKIENLNKNWGIKFKRLTKQNFSGGNNADEAIVVDNVHQNQLDNYLQDSTTGYNNIDASFLDPTWTEVDQILVSLHLMMTTMKLWKQLYKQPNIRSEILQKM